MIFMSLLSPIAVLIYLVFAVIGAFIGHQRGRPVAGFFLGLLLGPIGLIVVLFVRPSHDEQVRREAERLRVAAEAADQVARDTGPS